MTTPYSGCNVVLSWWMKLDLFAGLDKSHSLWVSHLCCGCTSRYLLIFSVWRYVVDMPFSREEDICHGFAFHAIKDGLPNSLCIISINKWRYRLCISNSVRVFGQKAHAARDCVALCSWCLSAKHLFPKEALTNTHNGIHLMISYMYVDSRQMAHINTFTMRKATRRFNYSHHAMPSAQIQWQSFLKAVTSSDSVPMFKVCGVHFRMFSFKSVEVFKAQGYRFSITVGPNAARYGSMQWSECKWYWNLKDTLLSEKLILMPINSLNCNQSFAVMICVILICGNFVMQLMNHLYLIAAREGCVLLKRHRRGTLPGLTAQIFISHVVIFSHLVFVQMSRISFLCLKWENQCAGGCGREVVDGCKDENAGPECTVVTGQTWCVE